MSRYRLPALVGTVLLIAGCAAPQGPVPEQNYYRLAAGGAAAATASAQELTPGLLMVEELRADGLHGERAMLYSEDGAHRQMRQYHYDHWVDPPTLLVQNYLVQRLRAAGAAAQVVRYNINDKADAWVGGRVERFEQLIDGERSRVIVNLELRLSYPGQARPALIGVYHSEAGIANSDPEATVSGFEQALDQAIDQFLGEARQQARGSRS